MWSPGVVQTRGCFYAEMQTRRCGTLYRYYLTQAVLKAADDGCLVRRISAGEIETAVIDHVRALLRHPKVGIATWRGRRVRMPI